MRAQVRSQLAAFGNSMEKDSAAQRGEVAVLVQNAAERGKGLIDDTLQLSNVQASFAPSLSDHSRSHRLRGSVWHVCCRLQLNRRMAH